MIFALLATVGRQDHKIYGDGLLALNDRISQIAKECRNTVRAEGAALFEPFARRLHQFHEFRRELVRCGVEVIPAAGREWGDNEANRTLRKALNADLEALGEHYSKRSQRIYAAIDDELFHRLPRRSIRDPRREQEHDRLGTKR